MTLWDELAPYRDGYGLVTPFKNPGTPGCDNGVLFTSTAVVIAQARGELTHDIKVDWYKTVAQCLREPGLLMRAPNNPTQEGPDDYVGYAAGVRVCAPSLAFDLLRYGTLHFGNYNNLDPRTWNKESFLARQPQLRAHYFYAWGKLPPIPSRLAWAATIELSCRNEPVHNTDARILSWLLIRTAGTDPGWLCRGAVMRWRERLFADYQHGMRDVFGIYFGSEHPIAKYAVEY